MERAEMRTKERILMKAEMIRAWAVAEITEIAAYDVISAKDCP